MLSFALDNLWGQKISSFLVATIFLNLFLNMILQTWKHSTFFKTEVNFNSTLSLTKTDLQRKDQISQEIGNEIQWFSSLGH